MREIDRTKETESLGNKWKIDIDNFFQTTIFEHVEPLKQNPCFTGVICDIKYELNKHNKSPADRRYITNTTVLYNTYTIH